LQADVANNGYFRVYEWAHHGRDCPRWAGPGALRQRPVAVLKPVPSKPPPPPRPAAHPPHPVGVGVLPDPAARHDGGAAAGPHAQHATTHFPPNKAALSSAVSKTTAYSQTFQEAETSKGEKQLFGGKKSGENSAGAYPP